MRQRIKIYDNKGNSYSMKQFKETVKQQTLKDLILKSIITSQKLLTGQQIKKFILTGKLHEVNFQGQIYFSKLEIKDCLKIKGINLNLQ